MIERGGNKLKLLIELYLNNISETFNVADLCEFITKVRKHRKGLFKNIKLQYAPNISVDFREKFVNEFLKLKLSRRN